MPSTSKSAYHIAIVALVAIVVTQLIYVGLSGSGVDFSRTAVWMTEAVAFMALSVAALVIALDGGVARTAACAIAVSAILNIIQVGMGIAMFGPAGAAGEVVPQLFQAVLAGAFWLYFAGKALFGTAAMLLGLALFRHGGSTRKILGVLTALSGVAALCVNLVAMVEGPSLSYPAGATGTVATLLLALALGAVIRAEGAASAGQAGQGQSA